MPHILIVEDEAAIADTLLYALKADGHTTHWALLGCDALVYLAATAVDLVVLDVGLPDQSGFEVCKQLRRTSEVPVIFLTARAAEVDRIVGLEIGADDYVVKPFSPREVAVRVRAILKRSSVRDNRAADGSIQPQSEPEFSVDTERALIRYRGTSLALTPHEFHILACLVRRPEQVFTRDQLLEAAGISTQAGYARNVDTHVKDLRAKLRAIHPGRDPLRTHRGFGYSYQPDF
jgi:two-component system catabolic regulation response regulator CreB